MGRHTRRLRWSAAGVVAVLVVGGGTAYAVTGTSDAPHYRTVAATKGDVEQTLASSGTVDAAHRADLGFGTSGTIASLKVAVGDTVKTGQVLAVLETTDLDAAVTEAKAKVAQAVAQLASDRTAQTSSVAQAVSGASGQKSNQGSGPSSAQGSGQGKPSGGSTTGPTTGPSTGTPSTGGASGAATAATLKKLKALQDKVISAQSTASAALAAAKTALAAQTAACADAYQQPTTTSTPSDGATEAPADTSDEAAVSAACSAALATVQARQQDVSDAQDALAVALKDLSGALTQALGSVTKAGTSTGTTKPARTVAARTAATAAVRTVAVRTVADTSSTPSGTGQTGSQGGTVTAARLASDQAAIEQAQADLVTAQQARAQAKLRSTRSGKVAALDSGVGDAVSAGDTVATVIGGQAVTVLGSVAEAKVGLVRAGQRVRVTVPGNAKAADGVVTAVGLTADTSSGSTSYPVTVTVEDPSIALPTGSQASLTIVLSTAKDVVTVPLSAVVRQGQGAVVRVWDGKSLTRKQVTLGAAGARSVAITSGLTVGTKVVLAAIDDPISGASSTLNERGGFAGVPGGGQFRRSGTGGGGFATRVNR